MNKIVKSILKKKFNAYCKHSTLHGVYYFYNGAHCWVYVIWALIIGSSVSLCGFLSHMIWEKFAIDPTLTVVESTHYSVANIPYPVVTVCDTEIIYGPNTVNITNLLLLRGYNSSQVEEFYESFSGIKDKGYESQPYVKRMHFLLEDLGYSYETLLDMFKKPCSEIIVECVWRSKSYNCSSLFRPVYTIVGHCCQFDIPYFRRHVDSNVTFEAGVEATEGLDIIVNGQKKYADGNISEGYTSVYIYNPSDKITLVDFPMTITAGAYFDVNIFVWAIDSSDSVKALSLWSRKCVLDSDMGVEAGFYQGCLTRLILQKVVHHCQCLPFYYTGKELGTEEYTACSWDRLICIYATIEKVQVDIKDIISQDVCYQRCDNIQYATEVEFVQNHRSLKELPDVTHSRISVHYGDKTCMKYRREVLYTWDQMLANLGGVFGLCLGGSIISVLELLWFLVDLLSALLIAFINKKVSPRQEKLFTITGRDMVVNNPQRKASRGFPRYRYVN